MHRRRYAALMRNGVVALLGSGETAPGMTRLHRELLTRLGEVHGVNLDTAYGFQENVPQMTEKILDYFATSLLTELTPLHFTSYENSSALDQTIFRQRVRAANYVFAGPGSPTYALAQWGPLGLVDDLLHVLDQGGTLCFSSAAVLTLGQFTPPIYEVYKAGAAPYWLEGLDLMSTLGLNCVTVPHFDNAEGGNYDTRRCYLGERRLALLEQELPDGVATLGIDEHTALIFDLATDTVRVEGKSNGYWRINGAEHVFTNGSTTPLSDLRTPTSAPRAEAPRPASSPVTNDPAALGERAALGGTAGLEALAALVQLASTGGGGYIEPSRLIEGVMAARLSARSAGAYDVADQIRDALANAGIEVQDGIGPSTWTFRANPR